eukprot:995753-Pleurochrysis_carterae.AAC.1
MRVANACLLGFPLHCSSMSPSHTHASFRPVWRFCLSAPSFRMCVAVWCLVFVACRSSSISSMRYLGSRKHDAWSTSGKQSRDQRLCLEGTTAARALNAIAPCF